MNAWIDVNEYIPRQDGLCYVKETQIVDGIKKEVQRRRFFKKEHSRRWLDSGVTHWQWFDSPDYEKNADEMLDLFIEMIDAHMVLKQKSNTDSIYYNQRETAREKLRTLIAESFEKASNSGGHYHD